MPDIEKLKDNIIDALKEAPAESPASTLYGSMLAHVRDNAHLLRHAKEHLARHHVPLTTVPKIMAEDIIANAVHNFAGQYYAEQGEEAAQQLPRNIRDHIAQIYNEIDAEIRKITHSDEEIEKRAHKIIKQFELTCQGESPAANMYYQVICNRVRTNGELIRIFQGIVSNETIKIIIEKAVKNMLRDIDFPENTAVEELYNEVKPYLEKQIAHTIAAERIKRSQGEGPAPPGR